MFHRLLDVDVDVASRRCCSGILVHGLLDVVMVASRGSSFSLSVRHVSRGLLRHVRLLLIVVVRMASVGLSVCYVGPWMCGRMKVSIGRSGLVVIHALVGMK